MVEKWSGLSQDNKVKLVVVALGAALAAAGYFGRSWFETSEPSANAAYNAEANGGVTAGGDISGNTITINNTGGNTTKNTE